MKPPNKTLLLIMVGSLIVFGGAFLYFTMQFLSQVTESNGQPIHATVETISLLVLVVTMLAGIPAVGMGAYVMYIGSRIRATRQWPPAGLGFRSNNPVLLEERATLIGVIVMGLGLVLVISGLSLPLVGWRFMNLF